jgi:hypothetical protein
MEKEKRENEFQMHRYKNKVYNKIKENIIASIFLLFNMR